MPPIITRVLLFIILAAITYAADNEAARVIILANSDQPNSLRLAAYYAEKRGVPKGNIIAFKMSRDEAIRWRMFVDTIFNPLQAELVKRGWIDAIGMDLIDAAGRRKYVISGHKISYLVVCQGVPLKVWHDSQLPAEKTSLPANPRFQINAAALDSELALLAVSNPPLIAFVPNPLFRNDTPSSLQLNQIVKVSRLDGPTPGDAQRLIDSALEAEKNGLIGRSYIDIGGPHKTGDQWLEETADQLTALKFEGDVDRDRRTLSAWSRLDAPAIYFGWYSPWLNGPFSEEGFKFPPGSIALHIHSTSGDTLRGASRRWAAALIARGVTATFGNVNEPLLEFTHQPHLLLKSLARGDNLGDAAAYSVPVYSWQAMVVGDPLYRPFKVSFAEQWERRDTLPPARRAYVVLRQMRMLDAAARRQEAISAGFESQAKGFHLAVALELIALQRAVGDFAGMRETMDGAARITHFTPGEAPLAARLAEHLSEAGEHPSAVRVWQAVLAMPALSREARGHWLALAEKTARTANDDRQAEQWERARKDLAATVAAEAAAKK